MPDLKSFLSFGGNRIKLTRHEYMRAWLAGFIIFLFLAIFGLEVTHIHNTFNVRSMFIGALIFATLVGAGLAWFLTKDLGDLDVVTRFQYWVGLIVLCMVVIPPLTHFTNRVLSWRAIQEVPVEYIKSDAFYASRFGQLQGEQMDVSGYFIFFTRDDKLKRIKTKVDYFELVDEKTQVLLPVRKGFWGWEYVDFD